MIEPALTPAEWESLTAVGNSGALDKAAVIVPPANTLVVPDLFSGDRLPALIALANAARSDDDPGKITRHSVWLIRRLIEASNFDTSQPGGAQLMRECRSLVDALESLLPPRQ